MAGMLKSLEICASAGGAALGLSEAGFEHAALIELDKDACATLRFNRPKWPVIPQDVREVKGLDYAGVDLLSGGVPCQPFSVGGYRLGGKDERDLFPEALRLVKEIRPRAVLLENVPGLSHEPFAAYRDAIMCELINEGYQAWWQLIKACEHGVPQERPRFVLVAIRRYWADGFRWPETLPGPAPTVGDVLYPLMAERGWPGADAWRVGAQGIAPTLTGNAGKTGGGPDLGQTGAKKVWPKLGVNPLGIAETAPGTDGQYQRSKTLWRAAVDPGPMLTVPMTARLQGFPDWWQIQGTKTSAYCQVAAAFPPPVARALGEAIMAVLVK